MTKRDELMFFEDYEEDVKQPLPAPATKAPTKSPSKKPENPTLSKNILLQNDEFDYDLQLNPRGQPKPSQQHEKAQPVMWQPTSNKKKTSQLPQLSKNTFEINKQIEIVTYHKPQKEPSPPRSESDEQREVEKKEPQHGSATKARTWKKKLAERKPQRNDDGSDLEEVDLEQTPNSAAKLRGTAEKEPVHVPKPVKHQQPEVKPMPSLDSDEDDPRPAVSGHSQASPSVEIKLEADIIRNIVIGDIINRKQFLTQPIPEGKQLQCTIKRQKGSLGLYPQYDVFLSNEYRYLMSAKKRSGNATSNYLITADKNDLETNSPNYLGKVRSNFMGTNFEIYDDGCNPDKVEVGKKVRKVLASVHYASNIFGSKGPRKMEVYVPNPSRNSTVAPDKDLKDHWEKEPDSVVQLMNKPPKWNELKQIYMLDFKGRVDKPSVKNFILTHKDQEQPLILLFGRVGEDVFHLDFMHPLSPVQALGIVMTSFDTKLACE